MCVHTVCVWACVRSQRSACISLVETLCSFFSPFNVLFTERCFCQLADSCFIILFQKKAQSLKLNERKQGGEMGKRDKKIERAYYRSWARPPAAVAAAPRRVRLDDQKAWEQRAVYAALARSFSARMRLCAAGVGGVGHVKLWALCHSSACAVLEQVSANSWPLQNKRSEKRWTLATVWWSHILLVFVFCSTKSRESQQISSDVKV